MAIVGVAYFHAALLGVLVDGEYVRDVVLLYLLGVTAIAYAAHEHTRHHLVHASSHSSTEVR